MEVLLAPPGLQDVEYDADKSVNEYISSGWRIAAVGVSPTRITKVSNNIHAQRKQYGLKHHITSTIHASMGDTLTKVALEISDGNGEYKLWDKAQVIVACS